MPLHFRLRIVYLTYKMTIRARPRGREVFFMDAHFEWQEQYNIGVDVIDREHQRLFRIINKLFSFQEDNKDSQWTCQEGPHHEALRG